MHKKGDTTNVKNYRPVSVLPSVSKVFERLMQSQINSFINKSLSKYLCGYRKGFSTQTALLSLIEKWRNILDQNGFAGAVLMDLSKAFDTINHELLIAKLHAYGFSKSSLSIIFSYLSNRWQHIKIDSSFSDWSEIIRGVPQGSVLGPLLFNIYLNDLIFMLNNENVCNFADDTTPYFCDKSLKEVLDKLEECTEIAISWFDTNYMKLNTDKCHLLVSGYKHEMMWAKIGEDKIWESKEVKLLGVTIDSDLKFDNHVANICSSANRKLTILSRMGTYLSFKQRRLLYKSFIESQFKYCPLIWMFHSRSSNHKINRLHERSLRLVYNDFDSSFNDLLKKDGSFNIHHQNIQGLAIEIYKSLHGLSEHGVLDDLLVVKNNNLRSNGDLSKQSARTVSYGINSLKCFAPHIWNSIPIEIKKI